MKRLCTYNYRTHLEFELELELELELLQVRISNFDPRDKIVPEHSIYLCLRDDSYRQNRSS